MNTRALLIGLLLSAGVVGCSEGDHWGLDQHGNKLEAQQLAGRWVLVNYWASWCGPCRREIPELNQLAKTQADLLVLGVNFDALQGAALINAAQSLGIDFPVLAKDPAGHFGWPRSSVLPQSYLIDAQGRVRARLTGEQSIESIRQQLAQLMAKDA